MATIVPNLTTISTCESTTGFTANAAALDTDLIKEGSNSIAATVKSNNTEFFYTFTSLDLTGETIRFWFNTINFPYMNTKALGGMRVRVTSSAGIAYWNIHGKDTYNGGWVNVVIGMESTPDSGTLDPSTVTAIGISQNLPGSPKNVANSWMDYIRYGDGLTVYGTPEFSIEEVYQDDLSNGYGVVDKIGGVYYLKGSLIIGDSAGANATIYNDENKVLVFADEIVSATLYKIQAVGNGTGDTDVDFANTVIASAGPLFDLDFDSADIESINISGCQISGADEILLADLADVRNNTFNGCGLITPNDCYFHDNTVSNGTGTNALYWPGVTGDVEDCQFIDNTDAIQIADAVDQTFIGLLFSGNTADVNNTSGSAIEVAKTAGSNPTTYAGSTVAFTSSFTYTIEGIEVGSDVRAYTGAPGESPTEIGSSINITGTEYVLTHSSDGIDGYIVISKPGFIPMYLYITYPAINAGIPITQIEDIAFYDPIN